MFELQNQKDFNVLQRVNLTGETEPKYWLGGEFNMETYPVGSDSFCQREDDRMMWWDPQPMGDPWLYWFSTNDCLDDAHEKYAAKYHVMCRISPFVTYHVKENPNELTKHIYDYFNDIYGSFQLSSNGMLNLATKIRQQQLFAAAKQIQNCHRHKIFLKRTYYKN